MRSNNDEGRLEIFSTCPPSSTADSRTYLAKVRSIARWSEKNGFRGMLVYSDNAQVDPWFLAQEIIRSTASVSPLVAVQPIYMHPYTVAKKVASLGLLYGRRVYLNMVAGGFRNDLLALDDPTPHDERYLRLTEYTTIIRRLLEGAGPVTFEGRYYRVSNLELSPSLPKELFPGIFVSGSSDAGMAAAREIGATAIQYPKPAGEYNGDSAGQAQDVGVRIGVLCREHSHEAWNVAHERFPEDRKGQVTHQLAMKVSDSVWHKQLSELDRHDGEASPYWLVPFRNYKTMCPYLVGDYKRVGKELADYVSLGYKTFILDVPAESEDLIHTRMAFERIGVSA